MFFGRYLKTAFLNHWNLLAFLGSAGFALLSGYADVLLPMVLAGEVAYVGLLGSHPKFQKYVDAQNAKVQREESTVNTQQALQYILRTLPKDFLQRFQALRAQCLDLQQLARDLKHPGTAAADAPLEDYQQAGLDRLLWIYLRLLYTQHALAQFLQRTRPDDIRKDIQRLEQQAAQLPPEDKDPRRQQVRAALEDNLKTCRDRLANLENAAEKHRLFGLQIDALENKIRSLSEMAVNRQEPDFITSEVDHVAAGLVETERTMNELQFATGLNPVDNEPPELLRAKAAIAQK